MYWQTKETLNQNSNETPDWKQDPDIRILHINYIVTTQSWTSTKSRHHNTTHLEERSLVRKDAFWAKSSINFKSSSSIMSSGRAPSSSSSSCFPTILEDDVYRLRFHMYIQTWKPNPAYTCETILHFTSTWSSSTFMHVFCVIPENCPIIVTSNNDQSKCTSAIPNRQILLPAWLRFIFFLTLPFL